MSKGLSLGFFDIILSFVIMCGYVALSTALFLFVVGMFVGFH